MRFYFHRVQVLSLVIKQLAEFALGSCDTSCDAGGSYGTYQNMSVTLLFTLIKYSLKKSVRRKCEFLFRFINILLFRKLSLTFMKEHNFEEMR